jgi:hypothetical protein
LRRHGDVARKQESDSFQGHHRTSGDGPFCFSG